jgi:hypothetical protein
MRRNLSTPKLRLLDPSSAAAPSDRLSSSVSSGLLSTSASSSHPRPTSGASHTRGLSSGLKHSASATVFHASASAAVQDTGGRTSEQGRDFLIELDGDLLSVYGLQALKFLDRPWNKHRAAKATTVQESGARRKHYFRILN